MEGRRPAPWVADVLERRRPVLDDELIDRLAPYTSKLPDETRLVDLRVPPKNLQKHSYQKWGFPVDFAPPKGWLKIYDRFNHGQKVKWSTLFGRLIEMGFKVVGDLREKSYEELTELVVADLVYPGGRWDLSISPPSAAFIKGIFE